MITPVTPSNLLTTSPLTLQVIHTALVGVCIDLSYLVGVWLFWGSFLFSAPHKGDIGFTQVHWALTGDSVLKILCLGANPSTPETRL